ncbi:hypothetical protein L6164_016529 [Bauhinia variegata]|uniref:Uncharacterized protein n=1 Tax=Bauhinia variegata TaxID=167791 RepID=A0ACB9NNX3_BAUVA|nr:hypothetical protein L6164_016529 [Bauhinia variegata]
MKTKSSILGLLILLHLLLLLSSSDSYKDFMDLDDSSIVFTYKRVAEVKQHCSSYLSLASNLSPDDNRGYKLRKELSFSSGDWEQENGDFPLMPFDESDLLWSSLPQTAPLKLVSFQVKDISSVHFENSVSIGGILSIAIARNDSYFRNPQSSPFYMRPGLSFLTIVFEGVYLESEDSGGERLMCLLGNTTLPLSEPHGDYWDLSSSHVPDYNLSQDDQILLVLRYPQTFNFTRKVIKGEMRSLTEGGNLKKFDDVHISSQLSHYSKYQFSSELMSRACDLHPYQEEMTEDGVTAFNGSEFCKAIQHVSQQVLNIFPNYKFSDRDAHRNKLGPFQPGKEINSADSWWDYEDFKLVLQHLKCKEEGNYARISAVLRLFPASIPAHTARSRTGLSSTTLSAEGTWDSSSGQLCMIGCPGIVDSGLERCNLQISLYFSWVFSIKQRSIILGSISSTKNESEQFLPLLFDSAPYPFVLTYPSLGMHSASYPSYNYSKIKQATAIRDRNQPSRAFTLLRQIFLKYPALEDGQDSFAQLYHLSTNLNFNSDAHRHQFSDLYNSKIFIQMEVLSLGPLFGRYMPSSPDKNQAEMPVGTEKQKLNNFQLLNISVNLMYNYLTKRPSVFAATYYRDFSTLFLEGVYDPLAGDMHLIGCRKVKDGSINLERGFDCLVEAKIHYPSETGRWLKNPSIEITISSQRNEDDPLYFGQITFMISIVPYEKHRDDVAFRKIIEGFLRILISLVAVGITFSQFLYMNKNADFIPYVSLVMLAQQILGYSAELTKATEILLESKESVSYRNQPYDLNEYKLLIKTLNFLARFLVLLALLITAKLYQKVSEARNKPNADGSNKPKRIPHYKHFILRSLKIHISVCLVFLALRYREIFLRNDLRLMDAFILPGVLMRQVETQVLCAQDIFLLPQIVENSLWQSQVKPLRKLYYVGLTLLRLILYFYDYIRDPVSELYTGKRVFNQVDSDFWSISGIFNVPNIMIVLAIIVHIQQSLNCLKSAGRQVQNP